MSSEKLARLMERFLKPLVDRLGFSVESVESVEVDPEGPRIIVRAEGGEGFESLYLDLSPDGVELTVTLPAPKSLEGLEEALADRIESDEELASIEEYDVGYDPEEGEVVVTLHARTINALPSIEKLRALLDEAIAAVRG